MKIVKFSDPFRGWPTIQQTPDALGKWGQYQFSLNDPNLEQCDFWVVCEGLLEEEYAISDPANTIFISWEPPTIRVYSPKFLSQFATVVTCHKNIKHPHKILSHQGHPWHIGKTYNELKKPLDVEKTKLLSVICSDKQFTEGHKKRFDFAWAIKKHFGDDVDLFGRGIRDFDSKWEVLAPYKYSIAIENLNYPHWLTEKLPDCFLAEAFPFYYGCPNIEDYFSSNSLALIDIDDIAHSIKVIERILSDKNHYERHLLSIQEAKYKYLDSYSLFPFIVSLLEGRSIGTPRKIQLKVDSPLVENRFKRIARRVMNQLKK